MYGNSRFPRYEESLLSVSKLPIYLKASDLPEVRCVSKMDRFESVDWTYGQETQQNETLSQPTTDISKSNIVIHVCDEAKNVKQDFSCPRDLLISEMKYFSDYFSTNIDKWEDVDISVHCDVLIFDWLMKYVKQDLPADNKGGVRERPKLEPSNVISILISSDFLKMCKLVDECISYCYKNMSAIIAIPCNMNCINEKLVTRISKLFSHKDVEAIKDKKDKFKSKLFCKKLEEVFNANFGNEYCPSNASTLFRCLHCEKLLTAKSHGNIECTEERTLIDCRGNLSYSHARDTSWEINDHLVYLKNTLKTWRSVFWRIWGTINYLYCSRCEEMFPCSEYGNCSFHPQQPVFNDDTGSKQTTAVGYYPCCKSLALKFNPINKIKGCTFRAHQVEIKTADDELNNLDQVLPNTQVVLDQVLVNTQVVLDQLIAHRDIICVPPKQLRHRNDDMYISSILNPASMAPPHITTSSASSAKKYEQKQNAQARLQNKSSYIRQHKAKFRVRNYEEEDQSDPEEQAIVRVVINQANRNRKNNEDKSSSTWDVSLPTRLNQDLQREDDLKRMNELLNNLAKNRIDDGARQDADKTGDSVSEVPSAGTYCKIEQQLRTSLTSSKPQGTSSSSATGSRASRFSSLKPG